MPEEDLPIQSVIRRPRPEPETLHVAVVYEDDSLIAIDKPPGMVVHPTYKNSSTNLLNGMLRHVRVRAGVEPSIDTRLDNEKSRLEHAELKPELHAQIQRDAAAGRVRKEYLAIVRGTPTPARGSIALPLARSSEDRRRVVVSADGQDSRTNYEVLSSVKGYSLIRCELVT